MHTYTAVVSVYLFLGVLTGTGMAVNIQTVPVGNAGNVGELSGEGAGGVGENRICGAVGYNYRIAKYEVTVRQYVEFLNAVAATDPYGLYDPNMWTHTTGCKIERSGDLGSYTYSAATDRLDRAVNYTSWADAARFANWMHNGQLTGGAGVASTEHGSYDLNGSISDTELIGVVRNPNAKWAVPTEDEWYKAAYHKNDGVTGNYWDYPTGTDIRPSNQLINPDPGNNANFNIGGTVAGYTIGHPYYVTPAGEFENSESAYGTFDQGGNVWETSEGIARGEYRRVRGGSWARYYDDDLNANTRIYFNLPTWANGYIGFRLVYIPEPGTALLLTCGILCLCRRHRMPWSVFIGC